MKANKSNKFNKTKYAVAASILTSSVAFAVTAPLIVNAKHDSAFNVRVNNNLTSQNNNIDTGVEAQLANQSPKQLYVLPVMDQGTFFAKGTGTQTALPRYTYLDEFLNTLGVFASQSSTIISDYSNTNSKVLEYFSRTNSSSLVTDNYNQAIKMYTDLTTIQKNYNEINGIGGVVQTDKVLQITKPTHIYDIASAKENNNQIDTALDYAMANFEYKIADIDLNKLKDQKSLVFSYKDNSDTTEAAKHDYRIVISNENHELENFMNGPTANQNLTTLLGNQTIFIRDLKLVANAPTDNTISAPAAKLFGDDKFKFAYDQKTQKLSLFVKPSDQNRDDKARFDRAIEIGIDKQLTSSSAMSATTISWGFLDNTYAPSHVNKITKYDESPTETTNRLKDAATNMVAAGVDTLVANQIPVYSYIGAWYNAMAEYKYAGTGSLKNVNWLRMYFGRGTRFTKPMQFNGKTDSDNFEDGTSSELSITYDQTMAQVKPSSFTIRKTTAEAAGVDLSDQKFAVVYGEIPGATPEDSYLQTDLVLNRGIMSISDSGNDDEADFQLTSAAQKTFFENPLATVVAAKTTNFEIRTGAQVAVADKNLELISDVLSNWSGKTVAADKTIASYNELLNLVKSTNANDFKNLDDAKTALDNAQKAYDAAVATGNAGSISSTKSALDAAKLTYDANLKIVKSLMPVWPFDQDPTIDNPKNTQMIFDDALITGGKDDTLKEFVYQYQSYYVALDGSLKHDNQNSFGIYKQDAQRASDGKVTGTMAFVLDQNGDKIKLPTTGAAIYDHFLTYTNVLVDWSMNKLALTSVDGIGAQNDYEIPDTSVMGWAKTHLLDPAGSIGDELKDVSAILARLWVGNQLTTTEEVIAAKMNDLFKDEFPNWRNQIEGKANPQHYPGGKIPTSADAGYSEYMLSKQFIYALMQPYFVKVFNKLLEIETTKFETNRKLALRSTFEKFFDQTDDVQKIDTKIINNIVVKDQSLANLKLISVGTTGNGNASSGLESLQSLVAFIYNSGLQNRFLNDADSEIFNTFALSFIDPSFDKSKFIDAQNKGEFKQFAQLLSTIIDKTFNKNQKYVSLGTIVDKIESSSYDVSKDGSTALGDLSNTIKYAVTTIVGGTSYNQLAVFGVEANYSYLQGLVMGKNLYEIFTEYARRHHAELAAAGLPDDEKIKAVNDFLKEQKQYDEKAITNLAISLGYYNLEYFVKQLTGATTVETMAKTLLSEDLSKSIQLNVNSDNQVVNFLSKPGNLAKYAFIGLGAGSLLIGGSIFGLSFRKSIKTSRKNLILERVIFIGIAALGIALALFGIIPGIL